MNITMLFYVLVLCLASWSVDARRSDYVATIQPYTYTGWGSWGHEDWCAEGSYAYGFRLKVEEWQLDGDDTTLNAIQLGCRSTCGSQTGSITSQIGWWGSWTATKNCPADYFLFGAQANSESWQLTGDDTAANNYNFLCQNYKNTTQTQFLKGDGEGWGSWTDRKDCPAGSYICGIKTQVEQWQLDGDDTALNGAIFYCCRLKESQCQKRSVE